MSEYYDDIEDQQEVEPAYAKMSDPYTHMSPEDLFGVQTKTFDIELTGMSPEELNSNAKNGYHWQLPEELKDLLKHCKKTQNRDVVTVDDVEGDLGKALFLGATVKSHRSTAPFKIAVDVPGIVPQRFGNAGCHCHTVPANVPYTVVNKNIFSPKNIFTEYMYTHNKKCDLPTLQQHIKLDVDPEKKFAHMDRRGVGWKVLMDNIESKDYEDVYEEIMTTNDHIINETSKARFAEVPYHVASDIYNAIAAPLVEIEKSYTDMNNFTIKLSRADNKKWNDMQGMMLENAVYGEESLGYEKEQKLSTPFQVDVELEVSYILN